MKSHWYHVLVCCIVSLLFMSMPVLASEETLETPLVEEKDDSIDADASEEKIEDISIEPRIEEGQEQMCPDPTDEKKAEFPEEPETIEIKEQMCPDPSNVIIEGDEEIYTEVVTGEVNYGDISSPPLPADQRKAIMALYEDRIMVGYNCAFYGPFDNVIRGDVIRALWRAAGSPEPQNSERPFKDAGTFNQYGKAIQWAYEKNITKGFTDGTFRPKSPCTRGQLVTFLWRYKGSPDVTVSGAPFKDVSAKHSFCRQIIWASKNGIAKGYTDKTFKPGKYCNRAQCATFIYRMLNM